MYSRVGRVCKKDRGNGNKSKPRWTTYLKSRLNCSISGEYPFYFNHLRKFNLFLKVNIRTRTVEYKIKWKSIFCYVCTTQLNTVMSLGTLLNIFMFLAWYPLEYCDVSWYPEE